MLYNGAHKLWTLPLRHSSQNPTLEVRVCLPLLHTPLRLLRVYNLPLQSWSENLDHEAAKHWGRLEALVRSLGIQALNWNVGSNPTDATS